MRAGRLRRPVPLAAAVLLAAAALALIGCGDDGPTLRALPPDAVILAFGDSLTHGTGAGEGHSYPQVLAQRTGRTVVRSGVPGEVTAQGLRRLPRVLAETRPSLVILCHGGNDILRKRPLEDTADNLRRMIALIRESGAQVVLLGVPRFGLLLDTAEFYHEVAETESVPLEDDVLSDVLGDNGLKSDAIHPNAAGYAKVAQALEELLRRRGAL